MNNLNELAKEAHLTSSNKGFWDLDDEIMRKVVGSEVHSAEECDHILRQIFTQKLMLIASEVFEAFDGVRNGVSTFGPSHDDIKAVAEVWTSDKFDEVYREVIKGGVWEELADVIIRIADLAGSQGVDLDFLVRAKMKYNRGRPHKHGKKF